MKEKIGLFCNVENDAVIEARDVQSIYEVPLIFQEQGLDHVISRFLHLDARPGNLADWKKNVVDVALHPKYMVRIAVVGKYIELQDAYKSIYEALKHGGIANNAGVIFKKIDAEKLEKGKAEKYLKDCDGFLVPGGFGSRGVEGKIKAIQYARENKIPYFGICLGMQCAVIEFARNVIGMKGAHSTEFNKKTSYPVISLLEEQEKITEMGGTMRLGAYPCQVKKNTQAFKAYKSEKILERHRHRYEFTNFYLDVFEKAGMKITGTCPQPPRANRTGLHTQATGGGLSEPQGHLVEVVEIEEHPWFLACQYHPEFSSKPDAAHPLFREFIHHALDYRELRLGSKLSTNGDFDTLENASEVKVG